MNGTSGTCLLPSFSLTLYIYKFKFYFLNECSKSTKWVFFMTKFDVFILRCILTILYLDNSSNRSVTMFKVQVKLAENRPRPRDLHKGRHREPSNQSLCSPLSAEFRNYWVAELNTALFTLAPERRNKKKIFDFDSNPQILRLQSHLCATTAHPYLCSLILYIFF